MQKPADSNSSFLLPLPILINENGNVPIGPPILLEKGGEIKYIIPDLKKTQIMKIKRKFPIMNVQFRLERMVGGKFQGANSIDFRDAIDLYEIKKTPFIYYNTQFNSSKNYFRYLRSILRSKLSYLFDLQ